MTFALWEGLGLGLGLECSGLVNITAQEAHFNRTDVRIIAFCTTLVGNEQWRNYERRSEAIASGRRAAGGARGRFWSTDCLLCTTEFSLISKERKKLKNKHNDNNLVYLYSFRTM